MSPHSLEARLTTYLALRKGLGMQLGAQSTVLADFVKFVGDRETTGAVTTKMVFDWLDATRERQQHPVASRRLSVVRQFLLHLSAAVPDTQVPEVRLVASYRRPKPFVFTPDEIERLLRSAAELRTGDFRSVVLHTILGLIAATGLRASEALDLDRSDVMPRSAPETLLIRDAKFHKTRIVPLHASTAQQLRVYAGHRELLGFGLQTPAFFVSSHGRRLSYAALNESFRLIVGKAAIKQHDGSNKPTLHSLRHTFVVLRLRRWHEEGLDVEARLAHLATYLGHVDFRETYWYMTATPELLGAAATDFHAPTCAGGDE
jgi:integrase